MANVFDQMQPPDQQASRRTPWPPRESERVWGYAGFWWRALAWFIDSLILAAAEMAIRLAFGHSSLAPTGGGDIWHAREMISVALRQTDAANQAAWNANADLLISLVGLLLQAGYFTVLESSPWQATLGKRACGLRVTGLDGGRISLARAIGRFAAKFLSALILCIGFLMVAWTRRKQGLHDILAETLVVRLRPPSDLVRFNPPA